MFGRERQSHSFQLYELSAHSPAAAIAEAQQLLLEYGRFVLSQPNSARFCFGALEKEAERLPASYQEQGGGCLLARVEGQPKGFVAWRRLPAGTFPDSTLAPAAWEMKRLWVRPEGRSLGLGWTLTQAVLDRAVSAGQKAVYLDTVPTAMEAAHRLYLAMGFVPAPAYNDNAMDGIAYFVRHLQNKPE